MDSLAQNNVVSDATEFHRLSHRLGPLAVFPYFQPEHCHFKLRLAVQDERQTAILLSDMLHSDLGGGKETHAKAAYL